MDNYPDFKQIRQDKLDLEAARIDAKNAKRAERLSKRIVKSALGGETIVKARTGLLFSEAINSNYDMNDVQNKTNVLLGEFGLKVTLYDKYIGAYDYERRASIDFVESELGQ